MTSQPLHTLIVMTYNQEKYVEEAVRAALAQECRPIEILISDDCSTDATWDVIEKTVSAFNGPHLVRMNRNERNLGLTAHLNRCVALAHGDIMVLAAGDDISTPDRVRRIAEIFRKDNPLLVHSLVDAIVEGTTEVKPGFTNGKFFRTTDALEVAGAFGLYIGATAAFHRDIFTTYGPLPEKDCYEDLVLGFRAALEGRVGFIDASLVRYRVNTGISARSKTHPTIDIWKAERRRTLRRNRTVLEQRLKDARRFGLSEDDRVACALINHLRKTEMRAAIHETQPLWFLARHAKTPLLALHVLRAERKRQRAAKLGTK